MAGNSVAGQGPEGPQGPQGDQGIQGIQGIQGPAGAGIAHDVVQARRTTLLELTTSFADVTFDATDLETDAAVIEHDNTNTDNVDIKVTGTYRIIWAANIRVTTNQNSTMTMDGRVRLNDAGSGINGSLASSGALRNNSISGNKLHGYIEKTFYANLTAGDFLTLQLERVQISGNQQYDAGNAQMSIERIL